MGYNKTVRKHQIAKEKRTERLNCGMHFSDWGVFKVE